jgi:hypothetical protein
MQFQLQMQHPQFLHWQHGAAGMTVVPPQLTGEPGMPSWDPTLLINTPKPTPGAAAAASAAVQHRLALGASVMQQAGFRDVAAAAAAEQ